MEINIMLNTRINQNRVRFKPRNVLNNKNRSKQISNFYALIEYYLLIVYGEIIQFITNNTINSEATTNIGWFKRLSSDGLLAEGARQRIRMEYLHPLRNKTQWIPNILTVNIIWWWVLLQVVMEAKFKYRHTFNLTALCMKTAPMWITSR